MTHIRGSPLLRCRDTLPSWRAFWDTLKTMSRGLLPIPRSRILSVISITIPTYRTGEEKANFGLRVHRVCHRLGDLCAVVCISSVPARVLGNNLYRSSEQV